MKPNRYQNVIEDSRRAGSLIRMFSELSHTDPNTYLNTKMQSLPVKSRFHQLVEIPPEPQKPQTFSPQEIRDKAINFYLEQFAKFRVEIQTTDIITVGLVLDYNGLSMFFEEKTSQRPLFFEYDQIEFEISNKKPRTFRIKVSPTQCFIFNASNQSERSVILKTFLLMKNYGIQDKPFDSSFAIKEFAFDQKFETDLFIKKAWIKIIKIIN
ncbi:hypothetical protein M0811_10717 [Anaeramoeba ignava]|uniref:Uncharacterized protein n=1 Tax=Anaeramoeba ignava TaxID=1746090 RepID=A0A9Q0R811_ANAIG|nr:hypothetical protein M0811_10717 [Anaeramoeba ignava]